MPQQTDKGSLSSVTRIKSKVKVVFLGEQSTGKTSILMRFLNGKFQQSQGATVGIDFMGKNITVNNHHLRLQLWDTAGQERFRSLIPSYLKDAMITMIVFDLTNSKTIQNMNEWIDLCQHNRNDRNIVVFMGNKADLKHERQVTQQQIDELTSKYGKKYFEVSAKTGSNILEAFNYVCNQFVHINMLENEMTFTEINKEMQAKFGSSNKQIPPEEDKKAITSTSQSQNISIKKDSVNVDKKKKKNCC